jgi:quercetin dioxygenase-like cupin family protein
MVAQHRLAMRLEDGIDYWGLNTQVKRLVHPTTTGSDQLGVSICLMKPGDEVPIHRHSYEEAYFVVRGHGTMSLDGYTIELVPDLTVYIPPNRYHGQKNTSDDELVILCALAPPPPANPEYR